MIAVETVIRKLVSDYEFVIIPGFGALLSHQAQAFYNVETGVFSPPNKRLAFNEFLKLDDGLLANFISRHEQITHAEAIAYVRNYTDRLRLSLQATERAIIEGIGEFSMNVEGKLVFEPNTEKYFKDEWYGFKSTKAKLAEKKTPVISMPVVDVQDEHIEVYEEGEVKTFKTNWIGWASAAMIAGIMCYFSLFFVTTHGENKSTLNPFTSLFEKMSSVSSGVKEKKTSPVVKLAEKTPVQPAKAEEIPLVNEPVMEKATALAEVKKETVVTPAAPVVAASKQYFLIAGTFKGSKQAHVLLEVLKKKGYAEAMVIDADRYSNKYKVAVESFEVEGDAYRASSKLKKVIGEEGWVFRKRH